MTTTTNIKMNGNTASQDSNNMMEEGTMNHENNNMDMAARISSAFRMENVSKLVAAAAVGLALTIGVAMPGAAKADVPSVTNAGSYLTSELNDDFSLVFGTPDAPAKLTAKAAGFSYDDDFSLVFGIPDAPAKLTAKAAGFSYDDDFSLVFGIPDAPAKVRIAAADNMTNDDFSLVYGTPDLVS